MSMSNSVVTAEWRPPFIRLTQIAGPGDDGPTELWVDPRAMSMVQIGRGALAWPNPDDPSKPEYGPSIQCTIVHCCHYHICVLEPPGQVAMLRDRALGHESAPPRAV